MATPCGPRTDNDKALAGTVSPTVSQVCRNHFAETSKPFRRNVETISQKRRTTGPARHRMVAPGHRGRDTAVPLACTFWPRFVSFAGRSPASPAARQAPRQRPGLGPDRESPLGSDRPGCPASSPRRRQGGHETRQDRGAVQCSWSTGVFTWVRSSRLRRPWAGAGSRLPMPCRRTFAAGILPFAPCMLAARRHPWLRWPASPAPLARAALDLPVVREDARPW